MAKSKSTKTLPPRDLIAERVVTRPQPGGTTLPPGFELALNELQTRVWRLRSLIGWALRAEVGGVEIVLGDQEAALEAVIEYADEVHLALDVTLLKERAAKIVEEKARERRS